MTRRYNWHDETPPRTQLFVVPSGEPPGPSSVMPMGKTWGMRVRGAGGTVTHSYRCPVHGVFDAVVSRDAVPDEVACPNRRERVFDVAFGERIERCTGVTRCQYSSPWAGSSCGIGWAAGEVTS